MKYYWYWLLALFAACSNGGGGSAPPNPPPPVVLNASPGGVWIGTRPNGTDIIVLIDEAGEFRILDAFGNLAFGQMVVSNGTDVASSYLIAPPFGGSLFDGSDSAACNLSGTIVERQSIDYDIDCLSSLNTAFGGSIMLTYVPIYDMDSSIARVAGMYDAQGDVLTVDVSGAFFLQDSQTGCVANGQVSILDPAWNMYGVNMTTGNCQGPSAPLNGAQWVGLATIQTVPGAEAVIIGLTADVNGLPVALVMALPPI